MKRDPPTTSRDIESCEKKIVLNMRYTVEHW